MKEILKDAVGKTAIFLVLTALVLYLLTDENVIRNVIILTIGSFVSSVIYGLRKKRYWICNKPRKS